tara:strand:- start:91 stop:444 length:354 start_codon:yes stop_codon:yes gene_type:complete
MSQNLTPRDVEYRVKSGSRATLELVVQDSSGTAKNLSNTVTYSTGVWKVWKPDGTLVINGAVTYSDRTNGKITYALSATDTAIANAGNWSGEIELLNSAGVMSEQTKSFNFTIEESY